MPEDKCIFGHCAHTVLDDGSPSHINGSCYAITEPDKEGIERFCKCDSQHGINQRLYRDLGFMPEKPQDMMVTKQCLECRLSFLFRRDDRNICTPCREKLSKEERQANGISDEKLVEIPSFYIFTPLPQEELQKVL